MVQLDRAVGTGGDARGRDAGDGPPDGSWAEVAWEVGVDWQGRGIASAAAAAIVEWLIEHGVGVVRAMVHPDHAASATVAARAGLEATSDIVDGEVVWRRSARGR